MNKMTKDQRDVFNTEIYYLYLTLLADLHYKNASFILYANFTYLKQIPFLPFHQKYEDREFFIITFVGENV